MFRDEPTLGAKNEPATNDTVARPRAPHPAVRVAIEDEMGFLTLVKKAQGGDDLAIFGLTKTNKALRRRATRMI